jgi:hypothetical protein
MKPALPKGPKIAGHSGGERTVVPTDHPKSLLVVRSRQRKWAVGACISVISFMALASSGFNFDLPNFTFTDWSDDGDVQEVVDTCVDSWHNNKKKKYGFSIADANSSGFYIYYQGVTSNTGNKRIPVSFSSRWRKADESNSSKRAWKSWGDRPPNESIDEKYARGVASGCTYEPSNLELAVDIEEDDLESAYGGAYSSTFTVSAENQKGLTASDTFTVSLTVVADDYVRVSGMDDVAFTSDFVNAVQADETFCIYSTLTDYDINISSANTTNGQFALLDSSGGGLLPISVQFADNTTGTGLETVTPAAPTVDGQGNNASDSCGGVNNAMLRYSVTADAVMGSETGTYATTFTLVVSPP